MMRNLANKHNTHKLEQLVEIFLPLIPHRNAAFFHKIVENIQKGNLTCPDSSRLYQINKIERVEFLHVKVNHKLKFVTELKIKIKIKYLNIILNYINLFSDERRGSKWLK